MSAFKVVRDNNQFIVAVGPFFVGPFGGSFVNETETGKLLGHLRVEAVHKVAAAGTERKTSDGSLDTLAGLWFA